MKKDFQKLYTESYEFIENFLHVYRLKYSVEDFVTTFADLYINNLEKDNSEILDKKGSLTQFRLIGSQPDGEGKGKKKVQLLRFGKKNVGTAGTLIECNLLIERFKQLREYRKIESFQDKIDELTETFASKQQ
ncbi:hypothetical protein [Sulfuricurvum sp.]|uniref:hypothetical protein n=1 Tax=Sulfuricurvum sp. TaxID=2025608 RepID=UPI003BB60089